MTATHDLPVAAACRCASLSRSAYYNEPDHWTVRDAEIIAEQEMGSVPSRKWGQVLQNNILTLIHCVEQHSSSLHREPRDVPRAGGMLYCKT